MRGTVGRMGMLARFALVLSIGLACGCSSNPPPDDPSVKGESTANKTDNTDPGPASSVDLNDTSTPVDRPSAVKNLGGDNNGDNSVPDDYSLTENDCVQLGKKLGGLWRSDLRASLNPKLNDKQRAKAEESIEEGANKKADDWADGCIKSLAGKSVDPKALKCAFDSKDLKTFEKCLN